MRPLGSTAGADSMPFFGVGSDGLVNVCKVARPAPLTISQVGLAGVGFNHGWKTSLFGGISSELQAIMTPALGMNICCLLYI